MNCVPHSNASTARFPPTSRPWALPGSISRALGAEPHESACAVTARSRESREKSVSGSRAVGP